MALGKALSVGFLAERLSPRGAWQLSSLGFLLFCFGVASGIWLLSALALRRFSDSAMIQWALTASGKSSRKPWGLLFLAGFIFYEYRQAISFTFYADDYYILNMLSKGPLRALLPFRELYHYSPVAMLAVGIPRWIWAAGPSIYHFANISLHVVNSCLVYLLALRLSRSRLQAYGSAILFSFFFLNYDPVVWPLVGNNYLLSTLFVLLSFLSFLQRRPDTARQYQWGFAVFYILAIFTNEISLPLIGACLYYGLTQNGETRHLSSRPGWLDFLKPYAFPSAAVVILMLIKYFCTSQIVVSQNVLPLKFLQNFVSACCFLSPFNNMTLYWVFSRWGQNPTLSILISASACVLVFFLFLRAGPQERTMLVWSVLFTAPAILVAEPSPRYFYLPSIGWSIFWAGTLSAASSRIARLFLSGPSPVTDSGRRLGQLGAALIFVCMALQGQRHVASLIDVWRQGSAMIHGAVTSAAELISLHPEEQQILVVNQPAWLMGNDFYGAPLLTTSIAYPLAAISGLEGKNVESVTLDGGTAFLSFRAVTREELARVLEQADTLVIQYDRERQRMMPYLPPAE
ncbi:hypothetical protein HZA56_22635 [Candidatus Poribacteria bacterium]|nr:hypothetical protein [Candidatus Poribacteria bacterium]